EGGEQFKRGSSASARSTIGAMLSGITTANTPPKKRHAASQPSITASVAWRNVKHTKQCRVNTAAKINAQHTRRRPLPGSGTRPIRPKSIWHSEPGSPSATRTVVVHLERPTPTNLEGIALQRPRRHDNPAAAQQLVGLDHRQALLGQPRHQLVVMGRQR